MRKEKKWRQEERDNIWEEKRNSVPWVRKRTKVGTNFADKATVARSVSGKKGIWFSKMCSYILRRNFELPMDLQNSILSSVVILSTKSDKFLSRHCQDPEKVDWSWKPSSSIFGQNTYCSAWDLLDFLSTSRLKSRKYINIYPQRSLISCCYSRVLWVFNPSDPLAEPLYFYPITY
jgi:hypothetical protein